MAKLPLDAFGEPVSSCRRCEHGQPFPFEFADDFRMMRDCFAQQVTN
jgi:hypothetical protein